MPSLSERTLSAISSAVPPQIRTAIKRPGAAQHGLTTWLRWGSAFAVGAGLALACGGSNASLGRAAHAASTAALSAAPLWLLTAPQWA
jgi:hypothetical protein